MIVAGLLAICLAISCPISDVPQQPADVPSVRSIPSVSFSPIPFSSSLIQETDARIDRYRKADTTVIVVGPNGRPIENAQVKVEQTKHAFLFGCAALSLLNHPSPAQEEAYEKQFGDLFNFATVLTYWQDIDPEPGRQNLDKITAQVERLQKMGIRVKGHPLIIAGACPHWVPADPDQTRALTKTRIHDLASHFKGKIEVWDVVGDVTTAGSAQNGLGAWARKMGPASMTADALTWAREASPDATLMYNDYNLDAAYESLVKDLGKANAPLDVLGLEAHMIGNEWPLDKVWNTTETFARLSKPLHFSEITVLSDDPKADHSKSWPTTPEGEQRQADYVEKLYTLLFSHPAVQAIGWWNFVDGDWDRNPAGFLRADLSAKPVYTRLRKLIKETWWTRTDLTTDAHGEATFRGFAGHYRFVVKTPKGTMTMEADVVRGKPNTILARFK